MCSPYKPNYFSEKLRASGGSSSKSMPARNLALELHNNLRRDHGAPPLTLDLNLCDQAEMIASDMANEMSASTKDSPGVGRNVYRIVNTSSRSQVCSAVDAVKEAVQGWHGYRNQYNWRTPTASTLMAKSFSQMVWKTCKSMGVGVATGGSDGRNVTVVVVLYTPIGNNPSDQSFMANVTRPRVTSRLGSNNCDLYKFDDFK